MKPNTKNILLVLIFPVLITLLTVKQSFNKSVGEIDSNQSTYLSDGISDREGEENEKAKNKENSDNNRCPGKYAYAGAGYCKPITCIRLPRYYMSLPKETTDTNEKLKSEGYQCGFNEVVGYGNNLIPTLVKN